MRTIRRATAADIETIMRLIDSGRHIMRADGNLHQWEEGYPKQETIIQDVANGNAYLVMDQAEPVATFAVIAGPDPTYHLIYNGAWRHDTPYYVIHRIASLPQAHGVLSDVLSYCFSRTSHIRIDTHRDNRIMRKLLARNGFDYCGIIHLANGDERLAFEKTKM